MLPRLTPSVNPLNVTITISENLRPYFEIWYQKKKTSGETPEEFGLRALKTAALNDHVQSNVKADTDAADAAREQADVDIRADVAALNTEV